MSWDKVADEQKDAHDNMFSDRDDVGARNLRSGEYHWEGGKHARLTSNTWTLCSTAAFKSMWSDPTPAVMHILRFFA
jgi:hypothetical protein